jgi:pSer/pThr/pTyr-binding forkhead associated (FHA) protein
MSPRITITVLHGPHPGRPMSYTEPCRVIVGRADDCSIRVPQRLEFVDVSRHHCELLIDPPSVQVRDLGSLIGTFVNGVLIGKRSTRDPGSADTHFPAPEPRALSAGDEVQVGNSVLRIGIHVPDEALVPDAEATIPV